VTTPARTTPDLGRLKRAVDAAEAATRTPPTPDATSWPITLPEEHLSREEQELVWQVIRYLRREERALYRRFLHERTMFSLIVNYFTQTDSENIADLVKELWKYAQDETTWLVDVPLSTLVPPRQAVPLGSRAILVKADPRRRRRHRFDSYQRTDPFAVRRHLGDDLTPRPRWLSGSQAWEVDLDTRTEASLLLVEDGIEEVAVSLAESKARLMLAMWCLLSPPRLQYHPAQPWPTVGRWAPAPFVEFGTQRKLYQPNRQFGERTATRRGAHITTHASYRLTRSEPFLQAPFNAIEEARKGNQCALALLSAARSLYLAECIPNELERTERCCMFGVQGKPCAIGDVGARAARTNAGTAS
jgi:hypothetical protein